MDNLTARQRSETMRRVHSADTAPELKLRRYLHRLGYRYRLHDPALPGKPDLVFVGRRKIIFIHGCFWHGHACRAGRNRPASNTAYWGAKLARNQARDQGNCRRLRALGWRVMVVWECQLSDLERVGRRVAAFLNDGR
jgi:DNA mismatch endonuclease (patch repair protein)